ncbi:MAG: hypothetical protein ACQEQZ_00210 [Pseudomonadota bacterium]
MIHRVTHIIISAAVLSLALMAYLSWSSASPSTTVSNSSQQCQQLLSSSENVQTRAQCQTASGQLTWERWFKGKSRSAQFHFIDLFELLFSSNDKSRNSSDHFQQQSSL